MMVAMIDAKAADIALADTIFLPCAFLTGRHGHAAIGGQA
jgi:hypothetical protein